MNSQERFYTEILYPFQDGVLNIVKKSNIPFYLTGGTALSRGYLNHRYSDDLDLFMNQRDDYALHVQRLLEEFGKSKAFTIDHNRLQKQKDYTQFILYKNIGQDRIDLKIDVVNDIASHFGGFVEHPVLGTIDSWQNILSNKLAAVFRYEPKDIVDIWAISKKFNFSWMEVIQEAKTKEAAVDPVAICKILKSFPKDLLSTIKWPSPIDFNMISEDLDQIAVCILYGKDNAF